ncbi:Heavy metal transport/detoxification superfamily protein [Abeliophyllum distichum]|uniref:Heavy metal transport/detoxification superfamily protein n=1 Tax=Abeliophyllum distichum TaxID=126358 RepID=A0ABD1PB07_9LAMI
MGDSVKRNDKINGRGTEKYEKWTLEESNELLKLMVDVATCGWRDNYEDLRIAVGSATVVGTQTIALGDDTGSRTFETKEGRDIVGLIDDFKYNLDSETFIQTDKQDPLYQSPSLGLSTQPLPPKPTSSEVLPTNRKRNRTEFEANSNSIDPKSTESDVIDKLTRTVNKITRAIESIDTREHTCWDVIKEIQNLDDDARFKALDLLNTRAKKSELLNMTSEKRSKWIIFKLK